jgi:hypothetical protein
MGTIGSVIPVVTMVAAMTVVVTFVRMPRFGRRAPTLASGSLGGARHGLWCLIAGAAGFGIRRQAHLGQGL